MSNVLHDGWLLIHAPNSPAALHLYGTLNGALALPAPLPPNLLPTQPQITVHIRPTTSRLQWEQQILPQIARQNQLSRIHLLEPNPALLGSPDVWVTPTGAEEGTVPPRDAASRWRVALAAGAAFRVTRTLWARDLPPPPASARLWELPPHFGLPTPRRVLESLPESFVLCHLPPHALYPLELALAAWTWVAPSVGELHPLVLPGLSEMQRVRLNTLLMEMEISPKTVIALPVLPLPMLAGLYERCAALLHPLPAVPWGCPLTYALAAARPIAAIAHPHTESRVGPAAYLVPNGNARALGAALLTLLVEDSVAKSLRVAASERAARWGAVEPFWETWQNG